MLAGTPPAHGPHSPACRVASYFTPPAMLRYATLRYATLQRLVQLVRYACTACTLCYVALCHAAKACTASREEGVPCLRVKGDAQAMTCGPAALPTQHAHTCVWRCGAAGKRRLSSPPIHTHPHTHTHT